MQPLNDPFADPYGAPASQQDPNAILNDCREVGRAIDDVEGRLQDLQRLHRQFVTGTNASNKDIDALGSEIMTAYRALADRVKRIKSKPGKLMSRLCCPCWLADSLFQSRETHAMKPK